MQLVCVQTVAVIIQPTMQGKVYINLVQSRNYLVALLCSQ